MDFTNEQYDVKAYEQTTTNKSIFIWLDILGFSDAVEDEEEYFKLSKLLKKFQKLFNEDNFYSSKVISDGIILQIKNSQMKNLEDVFRSIAEKQFSFILESQQFIRGGIAVGTKFEDNSLISNGLARAVKIESSCVNYPVIGTNRKNIDDIKEMIHRFNEFDYFELKQTFNKRGEDLFFIDFIKDDRSYFSLLKSKISEFEEKPIVRDKYIWLLRYYIQKFKENDLGNLERVVL